MTKPEDQSIAAYLDRLDAPRRSYADAYLAWKLSGSPGEPPKPVRLNNGQFVALRKRLDGLLRGESTFPSK